MRLDFRINALICFFLIAVPCELVFSQSKANKEEFSPGTFRMSALQMVFDRMNQSEYQWNKKPLGSIDLDSAVAMSIVHHFEKKIGATYASECRLCKDTRSFIRIKSQGKIDQRFIKHSSAELSDLMLFLIYEDELSTSLDEACQNLLADRKKNESEGIGGLWNGGKSAVKSVKRKAFRGKFYYFFEVNELEKEYTESDGRLVQPWSTITLSFSYADPKEKDFEHGFEINNVAKK